MPGETNHHETTQRNTGLSVADSCGVPRRRTLLPLAIAAGVVTLLTVGCGTTRTSYVNASAIEGGPRLPDNPYQLSAGDAFGTMMIGTTLGNDLGESRFANRGGSATYMITNAPVD